MRRISAPAYFTPLFLSIFLLACIPLHAQAAPSAGATAAPGQHWWLCQYRDPKDPYKPALGSRMYFALFPSSAATPNAMITHFSAYVQQNYKVNPPGAYNAGGYCQRYSDDDATRANSMDMIRKQWASGNIEAIQVNFADTPAQDAAIDAKLAGAASVAATAAATPTAAANQNYVWCHSAWAGTVGTKLPAGTVLYFSDIFPADMPPPLKPTPGHPLPPNANSAQINRTNALQASFFAFLQKKYGYKDSGNYPVSCSASDPPTLAGLQNAQKNKQDFEDMTKQLSGQVVETGWKDQ